MEQALGLVMLTYKYPTGLPEMVKDIPGVTDANFIYGPYDLYAMVKTEKKEELRDIVTKIREMDGVRSTLTCHVMPS